MFIDQAIRFDLIRSAIGIPRQKLLEVGCGSGELSVLLANEGHLAYACDLPTSFGKPLGDRAFYANGCALPVPSDTFDVALSCDVLEHVQPIHRGAFLAEMMRVTKPGGRVVMTVFVKKTLSYRLWGASWLMASGYLPQWYAEHATIPTPTPEEIRSGLKGRVLFAHNYQRSLNLLCMWFQNALQLKGLSGAARLVAKADRVGGATSHLIVVQKPA